MGTLAAVSRRVAVVAAAMLLGGCFFGGAEQDCESVEEYQEARSAPEIAVPPGLDRPDASTTLAVPDEPKPAEPLARNAACLQRPPGYFDKPVRTSAD
jgi:uncharacterized lipoprotein